MSNGRRRGSSIFAGLLLVLIGVLFSIDIFYPGLRLGHLIALYWPVLLILWGVAKIFDYMLAQRRGEARPAAMSGGEAALIVVLVLVLGGFVIRDWVRNRVPHFNIDMPQIGPSYTRSETLPPQTLPADSRLAIDIPRGDISVEGHAGNDLLVNVKKSIWGLSQTSADRALRQSNVAVVEMGGAYHIWPRFGVGSRPGASVDLDVQTPASTSVTANTGRGDIRISNADGALQTRTRSGDVEVRDAGADVAVNMTHGDARITGAAGNVSVAGRGGDVSVADVKGDVSIAGPFDGTIRAANVAQTIRCAQPWSQINASQLNGTLEADLGDVKISGASGPVKIATHNADVDVKNATGQLDITDAHADVKVTLSAPPREDIHITDDAGDVELTLPPQSAFEVSAISRGGDVESDFGGGQLNLSNTDASGQISGRVGASGGPKITIVTTYGTIHLRKTSSNQ